MTLSIWRLSHFLLAISTGIFLLLATVTGIVLIFEPISNQLQKYHIKDAENITISDAIKQVNKSFDEVISIEVDENHFFKVSGIQHNGESGVFFVNPKNGTILGQPEKKTKIFEVATNLHRSLFLKSTGRFIVGLVSFLLILIAISGIILVAKRQGGYKKWFSKVVKENFEQDYHVIISRYLLIPVLVVAITGVLLSIYRFSIIEKKELNHQNISINQTLPKKSVSSFESFQNHTIANLKSLEYPFSNDIEDYYVLKTKSEELFINQHSGAVISKAEVPFFNNVINWSLILHTGKGTIVWSLILGLVCIGILFFMYTGYALSFKRFKKTKKFKNKFNANNAEFILLVGSETGNTFLFATYFAKALLKAKKSVFVSELNHYQNYKIAKQIIIFTSTHGVGEAPSNGKNFKILLSQIQQKQSLHYSVLGFGSLSYPDYCQYAIDIDNDIRKQDNFKQLLPLTKINNQSKEAFKTWVNDWVKSNQIALNLKIHSKKPKHLKSFEVIYKTEVNEDDTFIIQLKPQKKIKFQSGDLLAIYPEEDFIERQYSIAEVDNTILLSVKKHFKGLCSNYLNSLKSLNLLQAKVKINLDFHFPNNVPEVLMIANGTGIAPFLGMIYNETKTLKHLFWGGKTKNSYKLYSKYIDESLQKNYLKSFEIANSKEDSDYKYVQDIISTKENFICNLLKKGGVIMICGAIAMQNEVLEILQNQTLNILNKPLSDFEKKQQIMLDCY